MGNYEPTTVDRGRAPLDPAEVSSLSRWLDDDGELEIIRQTGLSRIAIYRLAAGLSVQVGTRAILRAALARRGAT